MATNTQIIPGSIAAVAQSTGKSIAQTFMHAEVVTIVDTSGSMSINDSKNEQSRYSVACEELRHIQKQNPGKVAVISFSNDSEFCPGGIPTYMGGNTNLAGALRYAKMADVPNMKIIVISDGEPDSAEEALAVARTYKNKISVIYVGPESRPHGRDFLERLAKATGGTSITADRAVNLSKSIQYLLAAGRS